MLDALALEKNNNSLVFHGINATRSTVAACLVGIYGEICERHEEPKPNTYNEKERSDSRIYVTERATETNRWC